MIKGIGIDIIEIERIKKAVEKNEKFLHRIFTEQELLFFSAKHYQLNTIAGNFAAKEAVMKAMGTGLRDFKWVDIEILRDELGKPIVHLHKNAREIVEKQGISEIMVSISHSRDYAVAQAIALES